MNKEDILAFFVFVGIFVIPEIDATYITPKMVESGLRMKVQCHDEPNNCWIQEKGRTK
jgi:hypothetical protein